MMKTIAFLLLFLSLNVCPQGQTSKVAGGSQKQIRKDKSKPSVYIDFEKIEDADPKYAGDSKQRVLLKLTNNSVWSIYVGVFTFVGGKKGLYHYVEKDGDINPEFEIPKGYLRGDVYSPDSQLKPGSSVVFSVPKDHLDDHLKIRIDFEYEWERELNNSSYSNPRHSVYFHGSDIPT